MLEFESPYFLKVTEYQFSCLSASNGIPTAASPAISGITLCDSRLKKMGFNHLGLHWYAFHWDFAVAKKERNPKDGHLTRGNPWELFSARRYDGKI